MNDDESAATAPAWAEGPEGTELRARGKDGPQRIRSRGRRWTEEAEAIFLDHLAASCNVTFAAAQAGFSEFTAFKRRRRDAAFAERWQAALEIGYSRIETLLVRRAVETLEGVEPDPDTPIPVMTVTQAQSVLSNHRARVEGGGRDRRGWAARPRSLDEVRDSIIAKLEAIEAARWAGMTPEDFAAGESCDDQRTVEVKP
jgi:hypothetical protein